MQQIESTGGDGVNCTGCIYTSGNGETTTQCRRRRRRPWYDIASRLSRVECIRGYITLCKGWLLHSIKPPPCGGHGNGKTRTQCRPWSDLPNDILISIASRLGRDDYGFLGRVECIRFMAVCKGWLHSIKPHGHHNHLKPCLLVMENENLGWLSLYSPLAFPNSKIYKLRIPELKETIFRFSKDGWILLAKRYLFDPSLFLLNLLTGVKFDLPDLDTRSCSNSYSGMCFTSTPGSSDFMVVMIRAVSVERVTIFTYRPLSTTACTDDLKEEEKWTEECYDNSSRTSFLGVSCNPIFYKEKFYCLDLYGHLGILDHVHKNWTTFGDRPKYFVMNPPPPSDSEFDFPRMPPAFRDFPYKSFMVDLKEEGLISVFVDKRTTEEEVHIFRLEEDYCKLGWEKVDSLGMQELFIGQTSISTIEVPYGSWNNLYFTGLRYNNYRQAYSLETKAYDPPLSLFWRDYPMVFTWIELPMSKWESIFHSKWKRM